MLKNRTTQNGFSLIELAIGLVIVATLLSALLVPLATQIDQRRTTATQQLLDAAREALLGFVVARGRYPCPATATSNGQEAFEVGPPAGTAENGRCLQYRGFLPAVTLSLSPLDRNGFQTDAFGGDANRLRYAVADVLHRSELNPASGAMEDVKLYTGLGYAPSTAGTGAMKTFGNWGIISSAENRLWVCSAASGDLTRCPEPPTTVVTLAKGNAVAVILSVGKNGFDTVRVPGADEAENLDVTDANKVFASRVQSDVAGNEFDDLLVWISPNIMISRLVTAGKL